MPGPGSMGQPRKPDPRKARADDPRLGQLVVGLEQLTNHLIEAEAKQHSLRESLDLSNANNGFTLDLAQAEELANSHEDFAHSGSFADLLLLGFPYDEGVKRNGGRPGAKRGPAALRMKLTKLGPLVNREMGCDLRDLRVVDGGDIDAPTLESAHATLRLRIRGVLQDFEKNMRSGGPSPSPPAKSRSDTSILSQSSSAGADSRPPARPPPEVPLSEDDFFPGPGEEAESAYHAAPLPVWPCVPFVVGGGNDQSFHNANALIDVSKQRAAAAALARGEKADTTAKARVAVVNVDAHLDVRPLLSDGNAHSGSPFRQLLEDPRFDGRNFVEFAAQGHSCAAAHVDYVEEKGARIVWLGEIQRREREERLPASAQFKLLLDSLAGPRGDNDVFVSFDLDSIAQRDCPGVSAPGTVGLSADDALHMMFAAGVHPAVKLVDVSEFNPRIESDVTAKLLGNMFYYFAMGMTVRKQNAMRAPATEAPLPAVSESDGQDN